MSSMRNAVQRRNHKERAQPLERQKWGLLEKRKDYKLRAADHKSKQARLKLLRQKATDRNPDEFSFAMMSSSVDKTGRRTALRGPDKTLSHDVVKLLKTQDAGYIRTMLQMARKERHNLEQSLVVDGAQVKALRHDFKPTRRGHTAFVEDEQRQDAFDDDAWLGRGESISPPNAVEPFEDEDEWTEVDEGTRDNLPKKAPSAQPVAQKEDRTTEKKRQRTQERLITYLEAVKARERQLVIAEDQLDKQRAQMNRTTGGVNKSGVKFKVRERKR